MRSPSPMPWEARPAATGRSTCHFCATVRELADLRLVHVAGRTSAVYACTLGLAADFCIAWQARATREGIETEPSA